MRIWMHTFLGNLHITRDKQFASEVGPRLHVCELFPKPPYCLEISELGSMLIFTEAVLDFSFQPSTVAGTIKDDQLLLPLSLLSKIWREKFWTQFETSGKYFFSFLRILPSHCSICCVQIEFMMGLLWHSGKRYSPFHYEASLPNSGHQLLSIFSEGPDAS